MLSQLGESRHGLHIWLQGNPVPLLQAAPPSAANCLLMSPTADRRSQYKADADARLCKPVGGTRISEEDIFQPGPPNLKNQLYRIIEKEGSVLLLPACAWMLTHREADVHGQG